MQKRDNEVGVFAGGCFWCMVNPFDILEGVLEIRSGYTGGWTENPTYQDVTSNNSGHYEAVKIVFDGRVLAYETLLHAFWMQIDPTDAGGQFYDRGSSYRTAIFYTTEHQRLLAEASKKALQVSRRFDDPIVTEILPAKEFYDAEEYHQNYYRKSPLNYKAYKRGSGREDFIKRYWGEEYWEFMNR